MICLFHLDSILIRPDLLPLCLKARQASWVLTFIPVIKYNETGEGEFEKREPEILFACGGLLVLPFQAFQFTHCCPVHQLAGNSAVPLCPGARLMHTAFSTAAVGPAALALGCQHLQVVVPMAAQGGYSTRHCALFSFAESDFEKLLQ